MGRFRIPLLLEDKTWKVRYNIPKNVRYSDSTTQWTKLFLNFTVENYGIKLLYDRIDTTHVDVCFSNITIPHFGYYMDHVNCFKYSFGSIPDYRNLVLLTSLVNKEVYLLNESGLILTIYV